MVAGLRGEQLDSVEKRMRARLHLYSPGGQLACELAKNPTVLLLNDTLFAHGGVLPKHGVWPRCPLLCRVWAQLLFLARRRPAQARSAAAPSTRPTPAHSPFLCCAGALTFAMFTQTR